MARTKKLDRVYVEHVAAILRPILDGPEFNGNVTAMAKAMKVSQPQLQALMTGGSRGIGIMFLLAIRAYLKDQTLDSLLGLEPPEYVRLTVVEEIITRAIAQRAATTPATSEKDGIHEKLPDIAALPRRGVRK